MSERVREFNQVADFGSVQALITSEGDVEIIEIGLPEAQREAFEASMEEHNKGVVDNADVSALMQKLREVAQQKYYQHTDGSNDRTNLYTAIGAIDIVNELATNSITEGYFASDTVSENIALLPDGGVKAYDMGMIAAVDNPTLNPYDPEREERHAAKFGGLGAPFNHVDGKGVPTDIILFQPERYNEFLPDQGSDLDLVADL